MTPAQQNQIRTETVVGAGVNAVLSVIATWLTLGGTPAIRFCCAAPSLVMDALPHSFAVAFMATLVPSLLVMGRARKGKIDGCPPPAAWPAGILRRIGLRALAFGFISALTGVALHFAAAPLVAAEWAMGPTLGFKAIYGTAISVVVTPVALRRLFVDLGAQAGRAGN